MMFRRLLIFLVLSTTSLQAAEVVDRVAAVVGNEIITLSDIRNYSQERSLEGRLVGRDAKDPLEALIRERLLKQEMERLGLSATDGEVDSAVKEVVARNGISLEVLKGELAKKGTSFAQYKKDLGDQIRRMKFMGQVIFPRIKISDEEIARKTGGDSSEAARFRARMEILEARSAEEVARYLGEVRAKTYVEIKK